MSSTIIFIRHGKTNWNADGIFQGQSNNSSIKLLAESEKEITEKFQDMKFNIVISSPLPRCLQTAKILIGDTNCEIEIYEGLKEIKFGSLEGKRFNELNDEEKELYDTYKNNPQKFSRFPQGESVSDLETRVLNAFSDICKQYGAMEGKKICVVTHAGPIGALKRFLGIKASSISNLDAITLTEEQIIKLKNYSFNHPSKPIEQKEESSPKLKNIFNFWPPISEEKDELMQNFNSPGQNK